MIPGPLRFAPVAAILALLVFTFAAAGQNRSTQPYVYPAAALEDGSFMRDWILCGPFPNPLAEGTVDEYLHDQACTGFFTDYLAAIGGETGCAPQDRLEVPGPDNHYRRWNAIHALGDRIYFDDFLSPAAGQTGYAACWIDAEKQEDRLVSVGSDDGIRIWVNGEEVFRYHKKRTLTPDEHYLRLPLHPGRNQVLIKLDNGEGRWGFMMRPVANDFAMKEVINRLQQVLRFDYRLSETGFEVTLGDPTVIGNIAEMPGATITVKNLEGDPVRSLEVPLCRPVALPFAEFPDKEYTLEGKVLWPLRGRVVIPGMLYRGPIREEVRALAATETPPNPSSRTAEAYEDLRSCVVRLDAHNQFGEEPYAYRRLKSGLTQALESSMAIEQDKAPYQRLFPPPRQFGVSSNERAVITGNWTLNVADSLFEESLDNALFERWSQHTSSLSGDTVAQVHVFALETNFLDTPTPEMTGDGATFLQIAQPVKDFVPEDKEGYVIRITADDITVAGRTAAGAFYGLDTLLQLLEQSPTSENNTLTVDAGMIIDAPLYRTRAACFTLESFDQDFTQWIDHLADLRYNLVFLPSPLYPDLDDAEILPLLKSAYDYCRSRFVEPIPLVETFGENTLAATIDPSLWEGIYMEELPVVVDDLRRLVLPYDRILESDATHPRLRTETGYKILRKDRDYDFESYAPPVIQLKGQAPVQTGETVLISADIVDLSVAATPASCPSDAEAWLITERVLELVYTHLSPRGIHLGQTGAGYLNRDSRCLDREAPNALVLADAVQKGYDIVRKYDRKADVFIWGDHFNPMQRALELDAIKAPEHLPKDITILDWHYRSASYYDVWRVEQGIRYFDQFGFDTMGVVRGDPLNVAQFAAMKSRYPQRFRGIVFRPESPGESGEYGAALAGWSGTTLLGSLAQ